MLLASCLILGQNYSYWRKYGGAETLWWVIIASFSMLSAVFVLMTGEFLAFQENAPLVTLLRKILFVLAFIAWVVLGIRAYILNK
jgi:hypothetical protein